MKKTDTNEELIGKLVALAAFQYRKFHKITNALECESGIFGRMEHALMDIILDALGIPQDTTGEFEEAYEATGHYPPEAYCRDFWYESYLDTVAEKPCAPTSVANFAKWVKQQLAADQEGKNGQ